MQTTYAQRLRRALAHAGLSQAELARRIGLKNPQAVQYLAEEDNHARGSRHTSAFAKECGVSAIWLETGAGEMLPTASEANERRSRYVVDSPAALAKAIRALSLENRLALAQIVGSLSAAAAQGPRTYDLSTVESGTQQAISRRRDKKARAA